MRRTSGRVAIGLVLASTWAGACLSEQDKGDLVPAVAMEPSQSSAQVRASDIVVAVRSHLQRAFKATNVRVPGERMPQFSVNSFDLVGRQIAPQVEAMMLGGITGESQPANQADLALPSQADGAFRLRDTRSGLSIEVSLRGAGNAAREDSDGYVAYPSGFGPGAHIIHRPMAHGTEDYVYFPEKLPETPELHYDVALGEGVAGIRFVAQTIELLDAAGTPRLRMAPPYAVDGDGRKVTVNVALDGCAYDDSPRAPWRRPTVNPGATHCAVHLSWPNEVKAPLVVDPMWSLTTDMLAVRFRHTSTAILVPDPAMGQPASMVLVAGGDNGTPGQSLNTAELFDEATETWATAGTMPAFHSEHAAVNPSGNAVYIIGGRGSSNGAAMTAVSKYQISSGTWGQSTPLGTGRWGHTATSVEGGSRILVTGGFVQPNIACAAAEIFASGVWTPLSEMAAPRAGHTAVIADDMLKQVLLLGGESGQTLTSTVELCDVGQLKCGLIAFPVPPPMMKARSYHVAARVGNKVFVFGGGTEAHTGEFFDPQKMPPVWQPLPAMKNPRVFHSLATMLPLTSQKLMITGGIGMNDQATKTAEIFDVPKLAWVVAPTIPDMNNPRAFHTSNALPNGRVLVMGGSDAKAAEIYHCIEDKDCPTLNNVKYYCGKEGQCLPQKAPATLCDPALDCYGDTCNMCAPVGNAATGFCADGVCCNAPCEGICESCDQDGLIGQCSVAPKGPPRKDHGKCLPDGFTDKDIPCEGKCDGITRVSCDYIEGKSCGSSCVDEADRLSPSTNTELVCSAEGFCVEGQVSTTCGEYICAADKLSCRIDCTDLKESTDCLAGYLCSNGKCIPGQTRCGNDGDLVDNVVVSTIDNMIKDRCEPYRCVAGACTNVCETAYDCLPKEENGKLINYACDANRTCVPVEETINDAEVSCSTTPANESSRFGWIAAIALAGAVAARRNRPRA